MQYNYDLIIIGSGPGGEGAAMKATRNGLKVAIIEDDALGVLVTIGELSQVKLLENCLVRFGTTKRIMISQKC